MEQQRLTAEERAIENVFTHLAMFVDAFDSPAPAAVAVRLQWLWNLLHSELTQLERAAVTGSLVSSPQAYERNRRLFELSQNGPRLLRSVQGVVGELSALLLRDASHDIKQQIEAEQRKLVGHVQQRARRLREDGPTREPM